MSTTSITVCNAATELTNDITTLHDNVIIVSNSKNGLIADLSNEIYCKLLGFNAVQLTLIRAAIDRIELSKDTCSSIELLLINNDGVTTKKVVLGVLPTAISRHNTPSRSHALLSMIKSKTSSSGSSYLIHLLGYSFDPPDTNRDIVYAQAIAVGRAFSQYSRKSSSSSSTNPKMNDVIISLFHCEGSPATFIEEISYTIDSIRLVQRLVDASPNELHTDAYVQECFAVSEKLSCQINIIQGEDLSVQGFGGIYGVGKASNHLPALVILSHVPAGMEDKKSICLVGKGIVYDTGGLSIKVPPNMAGMKTDMGGSAAVLGAFETIVLSKVQAPVHALLCIAENSVGPLATRPDDIHTLLSGKTVEINNTDAEGRLVLSDGVYFASNHLNAKYILDIATLTGAQLVATGRNHAAIYCNDDDFEATIVSIGKSTGDLVHPIPFCPEFYRGEFKSTVADMKNSVADRSNAQASCAAQFIANHIEKWLEDGNNKWCHIDCAGPVDVAGRATGYGVALLFKIVQYFSDKI